MLLAPGHHFTIDLNFLKQEFLAHNKHEARDLSRPPGSGGIGGICGGSARQQGCFPLIGVAPDAYFSDRYPKRGAAAARSLRPDRNESKVIREKPNKKSSSHSRGMPVFPN